MGRDTRRFEPGPHALGFQRLNWHEGFPFSVAAVSTIERLKLGQSVTLLAGDNGSGKSTILEAIAAAIGTSFARSTMRPDGGDLRQDIEASSQAWTMWGADQTTILSSTIQRDGHIRKGLR